MRGRTARFTAALQALLLTATLLVPALAAATEIYTDLWIYQYGDTVTVTGIDFGANEVVDFVTTDPLGAVVDTGSATSDELGNVTYAFVLNVTVNGIYDVIGTGVSSGLWAATQFDPFSVSLTSPSATTWFRTIAGGIDVVVGGGYACSGTTGSNSCQRINSFVVDIYASNGVAGVVGAAGTGTYTRSLSLSAPTTGSPSWTTTFEFRTSPGVGQFAIPGNGKFDVRATFVGCSTATTPCTGTVRNDAQTVDDAFGVDNLAPGTTINAPSIAASTIDVGGTITDTHSGIAGSSAQVVVSLYSGTCPGTTLLDSDTDTSVSSGSWTGSNLGGTGGEGGSSVPGTYCIRSVGTDTAGNVQSPATTREYTVDAGPTVTSTTPANGATNVALNSDIIINFSESVTATGAISVSCTVSGAHAGSTSASPASSFTFNPTVDFVNNETCTVTVSAASVTDTDAIDPPNNMAANYVFSFSTPDAAPSVSSTTPANGATGVALGANVVVDFNESVTATGAISVSCTVSGAHAGTQNASPSSSFTFNPTVDFVNNETCTVTVSAASVTDTDAIDPPNNMAANYVFSFSTLDAAPSVTATSPVDGATGVAVNSNIVVTFSEPVTVDTSSPSWITVSCALSSLHVGATTGGSNVWTFNPDLDFVGSELCSVQVKFQSVHDADTNDPPDEMAAHYDFTFTTVPTDSTKPVITATATKTDTSAYVAGTWTNQSVTVSFSCTDELGGSGLATNTVGGGGPLTTDTSTGSFTNTGTCVDNAGNTADPVTFSPIQIDKTAPLISSSAIANALPYTAGTWTKYDVSVSFTCADTGAVQSGIATNTVAGDNATVSTEAAAQSVSSDGLCVDAAGNSDSSETFSPIQIDKTGPVITATATKTDTTAYVAGTWTNQSVTVAFSCSDGSGSGLFSNSTGADGGTENGDTATGSFTSLGSHCVDNAGNNATTVTFSPIMVDATAPVATVAIDDTPNGAGWFNSTVSFTTSGLDNLSGIASCTDAADYSGPDSATATSASATCTDVAGNVSGPDVSDAFQYDATAPVATVAIDDTPNGAGWFNSTVSFTTSGLDNLSGIASCTDAADYSGPDSATATSASATCTDVAGNVSGPDVSDAFQYDATAPVATVAIDDTPNGAGWFNSTVSFTTSGLDNLSGIASCTDAADYSGPDSATATSASATCTDVAGNVSGPDVSDAFQYDATAPVATVAIDDTPNGAGWFNSTVSFTTSGLDNLSGIASCTDAADYSGPDSATATSASATCTDVAGNVSGPDVSDAFQYDATAPMITNLGPTPNLPNGTNSWYTVNVSNRFNVTDATSGLAASCLAAFPNPTNNQDKLTSGEGSSIHTTSDSCTDVAGNTATAINSANFKIDLNDPNVVITSPAVNFITVNSTITVGGTASDTVAGSGVNTVSVNGTAGAWAAGSFTASGVQLNCGANTFTALATDFAGRTKTTTSSVTVTRVCVGGLQYYQPLDQSTTSTPVTNKGKFGRVIPVKVTATYNLGSGFVNLTDPVMAANGLTMRIAVVGTSCATAATTDTVEAYADAGSSNGGTNLFRWSTSQWIYNLDTGNAPSVVMAINSCYRLDVWINDSYGGTTRLSGGPTGIGNYAIFQPIK